VDRTEYAAGDGQKVVVYVSGDTGGPVDFNEVLLAYTAEAAQLERDGWLVVATATLPMRQTGTAGNVFFQSGGQYATQAALVVTYARR
jgi:hypothetical protein